MAMIADIYGDEILAAAANIPPVRRLPNPDASAKKVSRVCGSELELDLLMAGEVVRDFGVDARACALGQASTSMILNTIIGASVQELFDLADQMTAMLKEEGPPPTGERWSSLAALQVIKDYPQRHRSTLLIVEAIVECLTQMGFQKTSKP